MELPEENSVSLRYPKALDNVTNASSDRKNRVAARYSLVILPHWRLMRISACVGYIYLL